MNRNLKSWRGTGIRPLDELYKEMDSLFQNFLGDESAGAQGREFVPQINIAESEGEYEVSLDLPGLKPDEVNVEVHDNQLTVSGRRTAEENSVGKTYHRVERRYGEFRRVVTLPVTIDEAKIKANYDHGVLTVSLPKSEKLKPKRIAVTNGSN